MYQKTYRTFVLPQALDERLRERARASGQSVSRFVSDTVEAALELDQASLGRISAIAGALGVRPARVITNLIRTRLDEIEEKRRLNDPAALLLDRYLDLGAAS